jgi:hypothetical protein
MTISQADIEKELLLLFGGKIESDAHFGHCKAIGNFLGNTGDASARQSIEKALMGLEGYIQKEKKESSFLPFNVKKTWDKDKDSHLLTYVLTQFEKNAGFQVVLGPTNSKRRKERAKLYLAFVDKKLFREQLMAGWHWKDPTVSREHGEFTHRLQWYIIIASGVLPARDATAVMHKCGEYVCATPPARHTNEATGPDTDLWEVLFDRDTVDGPNAGFLYPRADSALDFRNPNNLNTYLRSETKYQFLSSFLSARYKKRGAFKIEDYIAQKKYGRLFSGLSEDEQFTVCAIANRGQLVDDRELLIRQIIIQRNVQLGIEASVEDDYERVRKLLEKELPSPVL